MWNRGLDILWFHVSRFYYEDLEMGLHFLPKITQEHIQLNSFSIMNVRLAVQILSSSVAHVLKEYGPPEAAGTSTFCELMDQFFDCMNVRNCTEHKTKLKPFLKPYTSIEDERFNWLTDVFLKYLSNWKKSIDNREGSFQNSARAGVFISHQTYEGLQITCLSMIEKTKYLLESGVAYVLTERFCQDVSENYFGRQRTICGRKDNPTLRDFGYNDNTIRNTKCTKSITGNVSGSQIGLGDINKIDTTPVSRRKMKHKASVNI